MPEPSQHKGPGYGNGNAAKSLVYSRVRLKKLIKDKRTRLHKGFEAILGYIVSGLKEETPDKVMQAEEAAFIKLRLELWKTAFFNGEPPATEHYLAWSNTFGRYMDRLEFRWNDDEAPDLATYLAMRAAEKNLSEEEPEGAEQ